MTTDSRSHARPMAMDASARRAPAAGTRRILILVVTGGILALLGTAIGAYFLGQRAERRSAVEVPAQVYVRRVINGHYVRLDDNQELIYAGMRTPYSNEPLNQEAKKRNEQLVEGKALRL